MLVLDTINKATIWGGTRLQKYGANPMEGRVGSLYTVAGSEEMSCTVLNGEFIGMTLYEVYRDQRALFGYDRYEPFPLLIGLVDASDDLSIQIHPSDRYAQEHEGAPFGKTESWIFLQPPASGSIVNGLKCADLDQMRALVAQGRWEDVIDRLPVRQDEYVFVPTGTLHALTAGCLVYEIQQSTDITYRFYDYDRTDAAGCPRPLQLEAAMANVDPASRSAAVPYERGRDYDEPYYSTRRQTLEGAYQNPHDTFVCMTLLEGSLMIDGIWLTPGMSLIVMPHERVELTGRVDAVLARPL